jgi:hypothetical protein
MRLAIIGKTRSGKSTALHRVLSHALRHQWAGILLLDGKGCELHHYAALPGVTYYGMDQIPQWATALEAHLAHMAARYRDLVSRGLREADPADPRWLIVAEEVQQGTRDDDHGKTIRKALMTLSEQGAALGDMLVVVTQRATNAVPPSARHNINVWLRTLGNGYFHLQSDGHPTISGRTAYLTPAAALATIQAGEPPLPMTTAHVPDLLGCIVVQTTRAPATLYLGAPGSGKSWHLAHHRSQRCITRRIGVDLAQPHRQALTSLIEAAGAVTPSRTPIPQLVEIAALALQAEPTLLLLDNLDEASDGMIPTVERLIEAAAEVALAARTPQKPAEHRKLQPLVSRVKTCELKPLSRSQALALVRQHLPANVADPQATERRILELGQGHPATLVDLARRTQRGTLDEVREYQSTQNSPINLGWLLVFPLFILLLMWRADGYFLAACGMVAFFILRRLAWMQLLKAWGNR